MDESPIGSGNVVTFTEVHATVLGLAVGFLAGFALALGYEEPALGLGMSFVAIALGLRKRGHLPASQRTIRREPWYALAAFVVGAAVGTVV